MNGELRGSAAAGDEYTSLLLVVARQLEALGESLQPGERILTGAMVRTPVQPGDRARAEIDGLGGVEAVIPA